jgi:hypothetical protein
MEYIDPATITKRKRILVEAGDKAYWGDMTITSLDGSITLGNFVKTPEPGHVTGKEEMIVTRIETSGLVVHDFFSGVKLDDLLAIQHVTMEMAKKEMQKELADIQATPPEEPKEAPYEKDKVPSYQGGDYA